MPISRSKTAPVLRIVHGHRKQAGMMDAKGHKREDVGFSEWGSDYVPPLIEPQDLLERHMKEHPFYQEQNSLEEKLEDKRKDLVAALARLKKELHGGLGACSMEKRLQMKSDCADLSRMIQSLDHSLAKKKGSEGALQLV